METLVWPLRLAQWQPETAPAASREIIMGVTRAHVVRTTAASAHTRTDKPGRGQALIRDCTKAACALLLGLEVCCEKGGNWLCLGVQAKDVGCVVHGDWVLIVAKGVETPFIGDHVVA